MIETFISRGYTDPIDLLEPSSIEGIIRECSTYPDVLLPWLKGRHSLVPAMGDLGSHPVIVEEVSKILGEDVLLWSSQIINQLPMHTHRWHIDVELAKWQGATVWIAMKNVTEKSIKLISGSHNFGITPQELSLRDKIDLADDGQVLEAAKKIDPSCELVHINIKEGQFIVFNGMMWHGTHNPSSSIRTAMIFQYTSPDNKLFITQNNRYPDTSYSKIQPDCMLVKGSDHYHLNRIIDKSYSGSWKAKMETLFLHLPNKVLRKITVK